MSHTVMVTRTTTMTTTSAIIINTGYFKTWTGILKLFELLVGIVIVGLISHCIDKYQVLMYNPEVLVFLILTTTFMIGTFLLLLSCLLSISTASILPKTIHEAVYHGFAFLLYLIASVTFIIMVNRNKRSYYYEEQFAAAILGFINSGLYFISTFFAYKTYKLI